MSYRIRLYASTVPIKAISDGRDLHPWMTPEDAQDSTERIGYAIPRGEHEWQQRSSQSA